MADEFKRAKKEYYSRISEILSIPPSNASVVVKGNVAANCSVLMDGVPKPFSCKSLEISITPKDIENGKEGLFVCGKNGKKCDVCNEGFSGKYPEYCTLKNDDSLVIGKR